MNCHLLAKSVLIDIGHPSIRDPILATILPLNEYLQVPFLLLSTCVVVRPMPLSLHPLSFPSTGHTVGDCCLIRGDSFVDKMLSNIDMFCGSMVGSVVG